MRLALDATQKCMVFPELSLTVFEILEDDDDDDLHLLKILLKAYMTSVGDISEVCCRLLHLIAIFPVTTLVNGCSGQV